MRNRSNSPSRKNLLKFFLISYNKTMVLLCLMKNRKKRKNNLMIFKNLTKNSQCKKRRKRKSSMIFKWLSLQWNLLKKSPKRKTNFMILTFLDKVNLHQRRNQHLIMKFLSQRLLKIKMKRKRNRKAKLKRKLMSHKSLK